VALSLVCACVALAGCGVRENVYTQIEVLNRTSTPVLVRGHLDDRFGAGACGVGMRVNFEVSDVAILGPDGTTIATFSAGVPVGKKVLQKLFVVLTPSHLALHPEARPADADVPGCDGPARPIPPPAASPPASPPAAGSWRRSGAPEPGLVSG
jgi:hypothetical protein